MLFSKSKIISMVFSVALVGYAIAEPTLNYQDKESISRSLQIADQASKMNAPEWLRMYDSESSVQKSATGVKRWLPVAQEISDDTSSFLKETIKNVYSDVTDKSQVRTIESTVRANSPLEQGEELYYFVSFSQPESEIKEILQVAAEVDARVVLRGMRVGDKMVNHTAAAMAALASGISPTPKVSIDSRLHKIFNIDSAPTMVYRKGNKIVTVTGVATVRWLLGKARRANETIDLGRVSTTYDITERDVIEEIQSRVAAVDWDEKRKKAMNRYISKLPDFLMPTAINDATYKIDPRVRFNKDITAKDGSLLATKGQVVNPLDHFSGQSLTLYVFDGMSEPQKALVKKQMKTARGKIGLMTSRIDKEKGFQFLGDLSKEYSQQVYMLQQRMISRFQLKHLPAEIYLANGEMIIREFGIRAQEEALLAHRNKTK